MHMTRTIMLIEFFNEVEMGLWILAFDIMSYFVIYNFGIVNTFIKYTAECNAKKEYTRLSQLLSTGMVFSLVLAALILGILYLFTDNVIGFFDKSDSPDARFVVWGIGFTTALNIGFSVYNGALTGVHRIDIKSWIRVSVLTVEILTMAVLLNLGYGIRMVILLYIIGVIVTTLLSRHFVFKHLPGVKINPLHARKSRLPEIINLGGKMQLLGIVALIVSTFDTLAFTRYGGLAFMGIYGPAKRLARRAQGAAQQGFGALAPASADLIARNEWKELGGIYLTAMRLTSVGCMWIFAFLIVNADWAIQFAYEDESNDLVIFIFAALCAGFLVHALTGPGSNMMRGAGMPFREMFYQILSIVFFLGLYFWVKPFENDQYIIATWPIARGAASLIFVMMANRFFKVNFFTPFIQTLPILIAIPGISFALRWIQDWMNLPFPESRWAAFSYLLLSGLLYSMICALASLVVPGLKNSDKMRIAHFLPGGSILVERYRSRKETS
jgi:O-antigen/teichoic acid export membrane protein